MFVSICNFSPFVVAAASADPDILGRSLIEVPFLHNGSGLLFWQNSDATRTDSSVCCSFAGSFSSCPLIPFCASRSSICLSLFVEPFPFNDLKLHISHSLSQYKRTRKESEREPKETCPFCWVFTVDCRLNTKASEKPRKKKKKTTITK